MDGDRGSLPDVIVWSCTTDANLLLVLAACSNDHVTMRRCAALKIVYALIVWICAIAFDGLGLLDFVELLVGYLLSFISHCMCFAFQ